VEHGQYFTSPELKEQQKDPTADRAARGELLLHDYLEFGDQLTEWKPFTHPQFGEVEIAAPSGRRSAACRLDS